MLKVNNRNARTRCKKCSMLAIKTLKRRQWGRSGVFIVNLNNFTTLPSVSIVNFEYINAGWEYLL